MKFDEQDKRLGSKGLSEEFQNPPMIEDMITQLNAADECYNNLDNPEKYYEWLQNEFNAEHHKLKAIKRMLKYQETEQWLMINMPEMYLKVI